MNKKDWNNLARDYHKFIISPIQKDVKNPLIAYLKKPQKDKVLAEFGCGRFELGEILSKNFKKVYAHDFSEKMIKIAKRNNKFPNAKIQVLDTTKMKIKNKFDIALSVNSIIMPSVNDIMKALNNVKESLKPKGKFLLIVPSMESILYGGMLILHKNIKKLEEEKATIETKKIHENKKYDYLLGHYIDGGEIQKFFYKHEIIYLLKQAGFKEITIQKVKYPWKKETSDYEQFPKEEPLWDWFISCKK